MSRLEELSRVQKQLREEGSPGLLDHHGLLLLLQGRDQDLHLHRDDPVGLQDGGVVCLEASHRKLNINCKLMNICNDELLDEYTLY